MAALTKNINESIKVVDEKRDAFKGVVSDVLVGRADISPADFDAMLANGAAVGYSPFASYIDGDYEYKSAILKLSMSTIDGSLPRALRLAINVDVPDVFDRGTATASAAGPVSVAYNRHFYFVGEVIATPKGGAVIAAPRVTNITATTFDIELIDPSNNRVAGIVSWSAKGY